MAEVSTLKLIMEKGPREGETLTYSSASLVKIGRVVTGNTIAIKDAGISSKHICIQFDNELSKWTLCDLDSSKGTVLNGKTLNPYVPSGLEDGDCIKIGELTSMIVKIGVESDVRSRRNPRRVGKSGAGVVEKGTSELELGFEVKEVSEKRNLRSRGKKAVDLKNEVEGLSSKRVLRSSKKKEVSFIPTLEQIPEGLNVDAVKRMDPSVSLEPKRTRGRKKMPRREDPDLDERKPVEGLSSKRVLRSSKKEEVSYIPTLEQIPEGLNVDAVKRMDPSVSLEPKRTRGRKKMPRREDPDLDERKPVDGVVPTDARRARGGRKWLQVELLESAQSSGLEENLNNADGSLQVDEGNEATVNGFAEEPLENVKDSYLGDNLDANDESAQEHVVEKSVSPKKDCKGKEVVEELEHRKDGCEGIVKDTGPDDGQWQDLENMTLEDFFNYMEVQLPKEIYDRSEKIVSDLKENTSKCHEFRIQRNGNGKGKHVTD